MSRPLLLPAVLASALVLAACGSGGGSDELPTRTPATATIGVSVEASCGPAGSKIASVPRNGTRKFAAPPERIIDTSKTYTATMKTSKGDIVFDLAAADVPNTVNSFIFLACDGFYDGLIFHRVVKEPSPFVIQGGDPKGDGSGGPGYIFPDEFSPKINYGSAGIVGMANAGKNTNGSQFFITLAPATHLNNANPPFGRVTSGMDVVNKIAVGDKILSISIVEK
ncbi:MAG TPA: peptidylprolyl isomerase [Dehalococcoidia bacterium]|nr:peptidylprolyl isomerase [Dehalococcoidia bacterium]